MKGRSWKKHREITQNLHFKHVFSRKGPALTLDVFIMPIFSHNKFRDSLRKARKGLLVFVFIYLHFFSLTQFLLILSFLRIQQDAANVVQTDSISIKVFCLAHFWRMQSFTKFFPAMSILMGKASSSILVKCIF